MKEAAYYQKEVKQNEETLKEMIDKGDDPYDIKKFKEVLGESLMMVPDSQKRLDRAIEELREFCDTAAEPLKGEWADAASKVLEEYDAEKKGGDANAIEETRVDDLAEGEAF